MSAKTHSRGNAINGKSRKDERRKAAYARDDEASQLSLEQKLAKLPVNGAKRQRERYTAAIAARKQAPAEKNRAKKDRTNAAAEQMVQQSR